METWFLQRSQGYRSLGSTCTSSQHHLNSTIQNVLWKVLKDGLIISVITRPPHDKAIGHHPSFWGRQKKKVSKCISIPTICHKFETLLLCHSMFVSSITMAINVSTSRSWKKKKKTLHIENLLKIIVNYLCIWTCMRLPTRHLLI